METAQPDPIAGAIAIAIILALAVAGFLYYRHKHPKAPRVAPAPPPKPVQIAWITERVDFTSGGSFCIVMLVLTQIGVILARTGTKSAIQEAAIGAVWVSQNVLWASA